MVKIRKKPLLMASFIYIYVPVIIFLIGFIKAYISLPVLMGLGYAVYRVIKTLRDGDRQDNSVTTDRDSGNDSISVDIRFLVTGIIFLILVGFFAGWGRWVKQSFDWYKHNAVLSDLIEKPWPVYYVNGNEKSMLSYYIGQYLVPALCGKISGLFTNTSMTVTTVPLNLMAADDWVIAEYVTKITVPFRIAEIAEYIWNITGLILVWMNLMLYLKRKTVKAHIVELFMLAFFSVPQSLVEILVKLFFGIDSFYNNYIMTHGNEIILQYAGNFVSMVGAFAQVIVPWLVVVIFLNNRDNIRIYLFYMLPLILFAPLPLLGLVPIALGHAVYRLVKDKTTVKWLKEVFSAENLLCLFSLGTVLMLYLYGNIFEPKPDILKLRIMHYEDLFGLYFVFVIINVLLYAAFLFKSNKNNHIFYIAVAELILLPLFRMGYFNDLNIRSSVPALFIIMCLLIEQITDGFNVIREKKALLTIVLYIALVVLVYNGTSYQYQRMGKRIIEENYTKDADLYTYGTMEYFADRSYDNMTDAERKSLLLEKHPEFEMVQDFTVDLVYNYYSYDIEENLFYKYVAR
ncbi:MAG: hypothetical protein K6G45_02850 [Lachnospiraceae bacterium]|nr:hypothetical protein [Lachnospiraceae bacterium]